MKRAYHSKLIGFIFVSHLRSFWTKLYKLSHSIEHPGQHRAANVTGKRDVKLGRRVDGPRTSGPGGQSPKSLAPAPRPPAAAARPPRPPRGPASPTAAAPENRTRVLASGGGGGGGGGSGSSGSSGDSGSGGNSGIDTTLVGSRRQKRGACLTSRRQRAAGSERQAAGGRQVPPRVRAARGTTLTHRTRRA